MKVLMVVLLLGGCGKMPSKVGQASGHTIYCLDGVQYFVGSHTMAVKIDKETLKPTRCK
jgi:hypothetical protein